MNGYGKLSRTSTSQAICTEYHIQVSRTVPAYERHGIWNQFIEAERLIYASISKAIIGLNNGHIPTFSLRKINLKISSAHLRPFSPGLNVLKTTQMFLQHLAQANSKQAKHHIPILLALPDANPSTNDGFHSDSAHKGPAMTKEFLCHDAILFYWVLGFAESYYTYAVWWSFFKNTYDH